MRDPPFGHVSKTESAQGKKTKKKTENVNTLDDDCMASWMLTRRMLLWFAYVSPRFGAHKDEQVEASNASHATAAGTHHVRDIHILPLHLGRLLRRSSVRSV